MSTNYSWEGKSWYGSLRLWMNVQVKLRDPLRTWAISKHFWVMIHEEVLYQVYLALPFIWPSLLFCCICGISIGRVTQKVVPPFLFRNHNGCRMGEAQRVSAAWHQDGHLGRKTLHQSLLLVKSGGNQLTQVYMEKWLFKSCVCVLYLL